MKRFFLSGLAFGALIVPAIAANMAPYYKAAPEPVCVWCGFYAGVNAGYAWSSSDSVNTVTTNLSSIAGLNGDVGGAVATQGTGSVSPKSNSFIAGGQLGYNWQAGSIVCGLVGRFHGSNLMPIKIGSPGWRCGTTANEKPRMTADTIGFLESVV
jgi:outer membrane immunogenic protein